MGGVRGAAWAVVAWVLCAGSGGGSPEKGAFKEDAFLMGQSQVAFSFVLKGMEETRVIASGRKRLYQGLYVYDAHGNCVAWDDYGGTKVPEDTAVIFVPPADGTYTVVIRSFFPEPNTVRVVVR